MFLQADRMRINIIRDKMRGVVICLRVEQRQV